MLLNLSLEIQYLLFSIFLLWLLILSFFFYRLIVHYNNLLKGSDGKTLKDSLENLLKEGTLTKQDINTLQKEIEDLKDEMKFHLQKVSLVRFNPFADTGGNQSFVLALLDKKDTGVVINSLHSRSGTRWYAKKVIDGKGSEHELSEEEEKAIKQAQKLSRKK